MKINTKEPRVCTVEDSAFPIIEKLAMLPSGVSAYLVLQEFSPLELQSMTCLSDWVDVLNVFDDILKEFIVKYHSLLFVDSNNIEGGHIDAPEESDLWNILSILSFTKELLRQSYGKHIYSSTEILVELLHCFNFKIMSEALECLHYLGLPPASHRCEHYLERHTTSLHNKNNGYFASLFDIVESSFNPTRIFDFLSDRYSPGKDILSVRLDPNVKLFSRKDSAVLNASDNSVEVFSIDLTEDNRDSAAIIKSLPKKFTMEQKSSLYWQITVKKLVSSLEGRKVVTTLLYQSMSILLSCHPDSSVLLKYFADKMDIVKDFIFFMETGPGTQHYSLFFGNDKIRALSCYCLSALLEMHDSTNTPIVVQYPWIINDLGVGRGQFMGLIPQLLRSSSSYLISLKKGDDIHVAQKQHNLNWIECFFTVLAVIVAMPTALPSLLENGLVSSLITIIGCPFKGERYTDVLYLEALALEILETSLGHSPQSSVSFRDCGGLNIVVNRVSMEVDRLVHGNRSKLLPSENILIQVLVSIITTFIQEGREHADGTHLFLVRNPIFTDVLRILFNNANFFSPTIISSCLTLLVDVINKDAAPPTVLNSMLAARVPQEALEVLRKVQSSFLFEIPINMLNLISAISITSDGQAIVIESQIFKDIFKLLYNDRYYFPVSKTMNVELASSIGAGLEEIIRHHPNFTKICLGELFLSLLVIAQLGEQILATCGDEAIGDALELNEHYLLVLNFGEAITAVLEPLLMKKQTIEYFFERKGFDILVRLWNISLGPPKFLLSTLASITYAVPNSVGYSSLQETISRCLHQIMEVNPALLIEAVIEKIFDVVAICEKSVEDYWCHALLVNHHSMYDDKYPFLNVLDTVSSTPLPNIEEQEEISICLLFVSVIRPLLLLSRLFFTFGSCLSSKYNKETHDRCIDVVRRLFSSEALGKLVDNFFVGVVKEMARAKSSVVSKHIIETPFVHPFYHLIITGDSVSVKDTLEEGGKKVARLFKGTRVVAFERAYSSGNSLKYRVADGWISVFKNSSFEDPQCIVCSFSKKSIDQSQIEMAENVQKLGTDNQMRYVFAGLTAVSARRAGVMSLFYVHTFLKDWVLSPFSRSTVIRSDGAIPSKVSPTLHVSAASLYPLWSSSISLLLPVSSSTNTTDGVENLMIPTLKEFGVNEVYLTASVIDLTHSLLFNNKSRSRSLVELNVFLLSHLRKENIIVKLLECTSKLFMSALNPYGCNNQNPSLSINELVLVRLGVDVNNCWYKIQEEHLGDTTSDEYNTFRLKQRERRMIAVSSLESVLEFWKVFLSSFYGSNCSNNDHLLDSMLSVSADGESSNFLTEGFKRILLRTLNSYLFPLLTNPLLPTLPPKLSRICIDMMVMAIKAQSTLKEWVVKRSSGRKLGVLLGSSGRGGMAFGNGVQIGVRSRSSIPLFSPDPSVVQNLVEMGFERNGIIAAMRSIHTNDPNSLVPYLLDNPYLSNVLMEGGFDDQQIGGDAPENVGGPADEDDNMSDGAVLNIGTTDAEALWKAELLGNEHVTVAELEQLKDTGQLHLEKMLSSALNVIFNLLEVGILADYGLLDPDIANSLHNFSNETFTISVVNQSFKLFDDMGITEMTVRLIEVSHLFILLDQRLAHIDDITSSRFANLVTSILLLTIGKISNFGRSVSNFSVDVVLFFLKVDCFVGSVLRKFITRMYELLSEQRYDTCSVASFSWCIPGLLLIDAAIQLVSVDPEIRSAIREVEDLQKGTNTDLRSLIGNDEFFPAETILAMLGRVDSPNPTAPLFAITLDQAHVEYLIGSSKLLLDYSKSWAPDQQSSVERAILQLLVHLQSQYDCREKMLELNLESAVLRPGSQFEGQSKVIGTVLQRMLEDDGYLKQAFKSSMKVVFERLLKKNVKGVPFKAFLELCCPLLHRNQTLFLECLQEKFVLQSIDTILLLKPNDGLPCEHVIPQSVAPNEDCDASTVLTKKMKTNEPSLFATKWDVSECSMSRKSNIGNLDQKSKFSKGLRQHITQRIMDEIFDQIYNCTFSIGNRKKISSLTIAQLLSILADLIVSNPTFLSGVLRYRVSMPNICSSMPIMEFLSKNLLCHPLKIFPNECISDVLDASRYLFAAIFSRSGETREDIGRQVILLLNGSGQNPVNLSSLIDTILSLVVPSSKWLDSFVIPFHETTKWLIDNKLLNVFMSMVGQLRPGEPQDSLTMRSLTLAMDVLIRKAQQVESGLELGAVREEGHKEPSESNPIIVSTFDTFFQDQLVDEPVEPMTQEEDWDGQEHVAEVQSQDGYESELEPPVGEEEDDDDVDEVELEEIDEDEVYLNNGDRGDSDSDEDQNGEEQSDTDHIDDEAMSVAEEDDHHEESEGDPENDHDESDVEFSEVGEHDEGDEAEMRDDDGHGNDRDGDEEDSSNHEVADDDVVDDEITVANGTDDFDNDIIHEPLSPHSTIYDEMDRLDDGVAPRISQMRDSRDIHARRNGILLEDHFNNPTLPPGLLQILSGNSVGGRTVGEDRPQRRSQNSNSRRLLGNEHVSIEDFVANVFQTGEVTSSSARVDPRTGSITLNISRRIGGGPNAGSSSNILFHPMLNMSNDIRRAERSSGFSQLINGGRSSSFNLVALQSNREQAYLVFETNRGGSSRSANVVKRKEVGPLLSDRRWGLDVGDIDPCGSNLSPILTVVENIVKEKMIINVVEPNRNGSNLLPLQGVFSNFLESILGIEDKKKSEVFQSSRVHEESKDELHSLQESKEADTIDNAPIAVTNLNRVVHHVPNIPNMANPLEYPLNANISQENVDFIHSLPVELRHEVLIAAEAEFLESLTVALQVEARALRGEPVPVDYNINTGQVSDSEVFANTSTVSAIISPSSRNNSNTSKVEEIVSQQVDSACVLEVAKGVDGRCPCSPVLILRIIHWLYLSRTDNLSTVLLRLLSTLCRYNILRYHILTILLSILIEDRRTIERSVMAFSEFQSEDTCHLSHALHDFFCAQELLSKSVKSAIHKKLLTALMILLRKTDFSVWIDIMTKPRDELNRMWIFGDIIKVVVSISKNALIDLDTSLHLVEKLCSPFAKLTVPQVNNLVSQSQGAEYPVIPNMNARQKFVKKVMPFPVLDRPLGSALASIVGNTDGSSVGRKSLMRIMRYLSLFDGNWNLLLNELSLTSADLVQKAFLSFNYINNALQLGIANNEDALTIMTRPEFSNTQIMWEVRLLNALRMMTVLRARSGAASKEEAIVVSKYMNDINIADLWDCLCDCLDSVREVEGIRENGKENNDQSVDSTMSGSVKYVLSSLVTRFIPLMECCMMVYERVALVHSSLSELSIPTNDDSTPPTVVRTNSIIPGSRFRQTHAYKQMHMEVKDEVFGSKLSRFTEDNSILLNIILKNNIHLLETSFSPLVTVPKCRSFLHFDVKRAYFKARLKKMRQSATRQNFQGSLRIQVRRSHVFEESFQALRSKTADEMRRKMVVSFHGEEGMDAGGLTREWYSVLAREIFNANYALFISAGDNVTFQPNPHSFVNHHHLSYFKFIGRIIGKAICDGHLLDVHFTRSFYKHILGMAVTIQDLEAIEPDYYKSLQQILDTPLDMLGLDLTFSAEVNEFGQISTIDLIPNGREVIVTDDNKQEYVKFLAHHRMTSAIKKQTDAFLEGFHELVPAELISIFDAQELELLISGLPEIDLDDLRAYTDYHGYKSTDPAINSFWSVLKSFSKEEKALFLQFVTGTSKVPLDGFKALQGADGVKQFNIHKAFGDDKLPTAHTCFNQLDLPEYATEDLMREKLLLAIKEGSEGFGFA